MRPEDAEQQTLHRADMALDLELLPRAFPNLVYIFISYSDSLYSRLIEPGNYLAEIDRELLSPLSEMVDRCSRANKCIVELPTSTFYPLMARARRSGNDIDEGRSFQDMRFLWEPGCDLKQQDNMKIDEAPALPLKNRAEPRSSLKERVGLWVKWGVESRISFDYLGRPRNFFTEPHVLH